MTGVWIAEVCCDQRALLIGNDCFGMLLDGICTKRHHVGIECMGRADGFLRGCVGIEQQVWANTGVRCALDRVEDVARAQSEGRHLKSCPARLHDTDGGLREVLVADDQLGSCCSRQRCWQWNSHAPSLRSCAGSGPGWKELGPGEGKAPARGGPHWTGHRHCGRIFSRRTGMTTVPPLPPVLGPRPVERVFAQPSQPIAAPPVVPPAVGIPAVPPTRKPTPPSAQTTLQPTTRVRTLLDKAVSSGVTVARQTPPAALEVGRREFRAVVVESLPGIPSARVQARELRDMHALAATRTTDGIARARHLYRVGENKLWRDEFIRLNAAHPLADAASGVAQLDAALHLSNYMAKHAKEKFARPRPFSADPTLTTAVRRPGGATSYPSSHAANAFAGAVTLGTLFPQAQREMLDLATEVAFSRTYAGVHYPSDIAAGAAIGAAAATRIADSGPAAAHE